MSDRQVTSEGEESYFCKICQVAFLNSDGLHFHYKDEEHLAVIINSEDPAIGNFMEEAYKRIHFDPSNHEGKTWTDETLYSCAGQVQMQAILLHDSSTTTYVGQNSRKPYKSLEDYILCPRRKEPLIGLQYIIQMHRKADLRDSFQCSLCNLIGPLKSIMYHISGFKHRDNYLSAAYKHLLPSYRSLHPFSERKYAARKLAFEVAQVEKTHSKKAIKNSTSQIGKSDFWKLGVQRQEKLEERKKKLTAQKEKVLQYMETLVITSQEEADLVQSLTEELENAMNVFNWNTESNYKSYIREYEQRSENRDMRYSRHADLYPSKKRSIWYEKEHKPSRSSLDQDEKRSISGKHDATYEGRSRKRSRSASKDMSLKVTFSTGSENEVKATDAQQEQQEASTSCAVRAASSNLGEATDLSWYPSDVRTHLFQSVRAKRTRKHSKDVEKWESLFANHQPEMIGSIFSWGRKSPSLNTEESTSVEKKKISRRDSLDALSAFTLFSQEEQEHDPGCQLGSETLSSHQNPGFKGNMSPEDKCSQHELKQLGSNEQELPSSSVAIKNEAGTMDDIVMHTEPEQYDEKCKSIPNMPKSHWHFKAETICGPLSDVNATVAQAPESSHVLDACSEYSDFKACGSRHFDTKIDSQDADSSVLTSGKVYASGRQLSPQVLQLFKGKDTNSIVRILKTLSPFYPALQDLDLEVFAEGLSKTGAIPE